MVNVTPKQLGKNVRMSFGKITEAYRGAEEFVQVVKRRRS